MARQRQRIVPWWVIILVTVGMTGLFLLGLTAYSTLSDRLDQSRERAEMAIAERNELAEDVAEVREQLLDEGIEPSVPPPSPEPIPPEDDIVITGERGPSCVEELGLEACRGPQGEPGIGIQGEQGIPGPSCGEEFGFEACRGEPGIPGESIVGPTGPAGEPGEPGADGESIVGPAGPQGPPGPAGADGVDGRGIVSVEFVNGGDCRMRITYTDATADEFPMPASMCKPAETESIE